MEAKRVGPLLTLALEQLGTIGKLAMDFSHQFSAQIIARHYLAVEIMPADAQLGKKSAPKVP